jgi:hypothetical protein
MYVANGTGPLLWMSSKMIFSMGVQACNEDWDRFGTVAEAVAARRGTRRDLVSACLSIIMTVSRRCV